MIVIPFEIPAGSPRGPVVVVLVLEKENLDRMKAGDPLDIHFRAYRAHMHTDRPIRDLDFVIAYEEDLNAIMGFAKQKDLPGLMRHLQRGRKIQPGDVLPPSPLRKS